MRYLIVLLLAGCATQPTVIRDRPTQVSIPVIQPCASERPAPIVPMNQRYSETEWEGLSFKQRAEIVAVQGLARMNYADSLNAATSAC